MLTDDQILAGTASALRAANKYFREEAGGFYLAPATYLIPPDWKIAYEGNIDLDVLISRIIDGLTDGIRKVTDERG